MPDNPEPQIIEKTLKDFLENVPPGQEVIVTDFLISTTDRPESVRLNNPRLQLHCEVCKGLRVFSRLTPVENSKTNSAHEFWFFTCRNCQGQTKVYAIHHMAEEFSDKHRLMYKFGEFPAFGLPTPTHVSTLIGQERDYYFKGRRSENQGLGIAAFAYYRRVVESRKNIIFDEIIRVAEANDASAEMLADLNAAKNEDQFSKAVDAVKHGIPDALKINGVNPLTLLHSALSEGLHARSDAQCLETATSIRIILTELVERMAIALNDDEELNTAVNKLLRLKNKTQV